MYYQYFMWFRGAYTGAFLPGVPSSAGDYLVIEQLISSMYTTFYFQHLEAITFVSVYGRDLQNQISQRKKEIEAHIKTGDSLEHTCKIFSDRYVYLVKLLCSDFLPMESKLLEKELPPEKISAISRDMESGCKAYYETYGSTAYDWMNETHFNGLWKRYNALILTFDNTIDPAGTREEDFQLCTALLMSRVWRECLSTANATFNTFNALKKHLMQRKGGSHNTTHQDGTVKQEGWK